MFWLILFLPLVSFALISLFLLKHPTRAALISIGSACIGALLAIFTVLKGSVMQAPSLTWLEVSTLKVTIGFLWDPLSQLMTLIVTCVGALIHIFSWSYMRDDQGKARYFGYLSLFMFSMLGITLAGNFVMLFIFWELVGLSSYLLIGFWYEKPAAAEAGKKAFLVNKLGDFGFMLGIILVWVIWKTVDFQVLFAKSASLISEHGASDYAHISITVIALLLFCGAVGKSAQFPLHVWLPAAMEGPTPVSALIHAATMVAAGVYMLCRIFFILSLSPEALAVIAWIGAITMFFAALWAIAEDDIKRILAYSTLSQLGLMVMSVGLSGPGSAMFHLTTHAFFKALLFLAAGSVLVALHHEQNIWKMGGLYSRMPITFLAFSIGMLALCGTPLFSGFYSKDEILLLAYDQNRTLFCLGTFTVFLTAFYMGRLWFVAFWDKPRDERVEHAHENGFSMGLPLVILAILSVISGWKFVGFSTYLDHFVGFTSSPLSTHLGAIHFLLMAIPFLGLGLAMILYRQKTNVDFLEMKLPLLQHFLASKFRFDEAYDWFIRNIQGRFAAWLRCLDSWIIDGLCVTGVSLGIRCFGNMIRCFQTGNLQTYVVYVGLALVIIIYWMVIR